MAAPPSSHLQNMLQTAVQSVQWTYSLFWQLCPQQGILIWGDGYYNGAIKTRKTVQPMEVSTEEASLQRSQQLRELYDSLSAGETNQPARRPCAALSPEDLTESEWFYLMCVSFSFPLGIGLPGKAYAKRQHVWLTGANEVDSKVFSRAILAKSARIQTVVCIPLMDGVVEFGTTERVQEDTAFVQHVKTFFTDHHIHHHHHHNHNHNPPPKPALSEHSTSNPATSSEHQRFPPPLPIMYAAADPPTNANQEEEDEEEDDDEEGDSDSEAETGRNNNNGGQLAVATQNHPHSVTHGVATASRTAAEPSELMQLEMSEDIRLGSPDDASNNLDSDFHLLAVSQAGNHPADHQRRDDSFRAESTRRWPTLPDPMSSGLQPPPSGPKSTFQKQMVAGKIVPWSCCMKSSYSLKTTIPFCTAQGTPQLEELTQEDTHYSQTVAAILQIQPTRWSESTPTTGYILYSTQSAFTKWTTSRADHLHHVPVEGTSQWLLKYILFSVPFLHNKYRDENSPKSRDTADAANRFRKGTPQDELSANHVLAERRRREKLNERFIILRSLVPFVTKMDKASILGDTIEYVKQLRRKIQDLETRTRQMEVEQRTRIAAAAVETPRSSGGSKEQRSSGVSGLDRSRVGSGSDKRKMRIVEGAGGAKNKVVVDSPPPPSAVVVVPPAPVALPGNAVQVQVSIIESDALVELQCPYREGLLLDTMLILRDMRVETTAVQSSLTNGVFVAELRAKVKENVNGKKASIVEVKRAIHQIIP